MILEELTLRNWRQYREEHRFCFGEGTSLLVGPNEAGKSTLFEALSRCVFDRHTSKSAEIKSIQPLGSSLGPEVSLTWSSAVGRLRIVKRFIQEPVAELYRERDGVFELDHEGDRADREIRRLFDAAEARGTAKHQHRGLAQALWFLERDEPLPRSEWDRSVRGGLEALAHRGLLREGERRLEEAIERAYAEHYTPKGRISARSELSELQREVRALEEEAAQTNEQLDRLRGLDRALETLASRGVETEKEASGIRDKLEAIEPGLHLSRRLAKERGEAEESLKDALKRRSDLKESLPKLRRSERRLAKVEESVVNEGSEKEARVQGLEKDHRALADLRKRRARSHGSALERLRPELEELRAGDRVEALRREEKRLSEQLDELTGLRDEVDSLATELAVTEVPSAEEWKKLVHAENRLEVLLEGPGDVLVEVSFDLRGSDLQIRSEPPVEAKDDDTYEIRKPTRFSLGKEVQMLVRPVRAEARSEIEALEKEIKEVAQRSGLDRKALGQQYEARARGLERLQVRRALLESAVSREAHSVKRLTEVRLELGQLEERFLQPLLPGVDEWTGERRRLRLEELVQERDRLERALSEEEREERELERRYLTALEETRAKEAEIADLVEKAVECRALALTRLQGFESRTAMELAAEAAQKSVLEARRELTRLDSAEAARLEKQSLELEEEAARLRVLATAIDADIADRSSRRDELSRLGLHARIGELEATLEARKERLSSSLKRAEAVRLLRDMTVAYRAGGSLTLSEPVRETLSRWWSFLTDDTYTNVSLDERLLPGDVESRRYDTRLPLANISYGAWEQIVVLVRLAIAFSLSAEERRLVVLDDKLVHADPDRMGRFTRIVEEVSERCQVLIATCNEQSYSSLDAQRIEVPASGRLRS